MSDVDKKRKGPIAVLKYGALTGRSKRPSNEKGLKSSDDSLGGADSTPTTSIPSHHLLSFTPPGPSGIVHIEQGTELEKLSAKLFGVPLLAGTNFGLHIHPGSDAHVPLLVQDTVDWLAHYSTIEIPPLACPSNFPTLDSPL